MARRAALAASAAAAMATATLITTGAAQAAPATLAVQQVPNVGVTVSTSNGVTDAFAARLAATPAAAGSTQLSIRPENAKACSTNLANSRAAITWRNMTTNKSDDIVFPVCAAGKPSAGVVVPTGAGRITFTTTIIDRTQQTFTVSPGSGSFRR
ncbi:hypothetical protein AAFP30_16900 [Gordonia sp. CPCC 205515]|uniref:hypothetical protein n=1 Tax=Gordonia sp. CPCC 205515 TaxID=3140791 RepID=UPI003AF3988A